MSELQPSDLQSFTLGRLSATDPNTAIVLSAALQHLRSYCRWKVTPVETNAQLTIDGPGQFGGLSVGVGGLYYASGSYVAGVLRRARYGGDTLFLPTKRLLDVSSIVEDGNALQPIEDYIWSERGAVVKTSGEPWTSNFQGLTVTYSDGYTEDEAADWRRLVLAMADRMSMVRGLIGPFSATMGPYRVNAYYGESRTGTLPLTASWLDDLTGLVDGPRYVRIEV